MADEYIKRSEVKDELLSWAVCIKHPEHLLREDALHVLDSIPAADVAPVVHGLWEERDDGWDGVYYSCSACGADWCTIDGTPAENNMHYCPKCGAKMDAECEHEFVYDEMRGEAVCKKCGHALTAEEKRAALEHANELRRAEEADAE